MANSLARMKRGIVELLLGALLPGCGAQMPNNSPLISQSPPRNDARRAEAANPTASLSPVKVAEGKKIAEQKQCVVCHVNGGNIANPSRTWKSEKFRKKYSDDGQLAEVIRNGIPGTAMVAFTKDKLSDEELSKVIAYIRSFNQ